MPDFKMNKNPQKGDMIAWLNNLAIVLDGKAVYVYFVRGKKEGTFQNICFCESCLSLIKKIT